MNISETESMVVWFRNGERRTREDSVTHSAEVRGNGPSTAGSVQAPDVKS